MARSSGWGRNPAPDVASCDGENTAKTVHQPQKDWSASASGFEGLSHVGGYAEIRGERRYRLASIVPVHHGLLSDRVPGTFGHVQGAEHELD